MTPESIVERLRRPTRLPDNPFSYEYFQKELKFFGVRKDMEQGNVCVKVKQLSGMCSDFLNKNYRIMSDKIPVLFGRETEEDSWCLWMSITPMEVQSMYLPILEADGTVWTAGLGLGYYPLRVASKDSVDKVIVYETNSDTIKLFKRRYRKRKCFSKIEIREGDFRVDCLDKGLPDQADFIFMDVYATRNSDLLKEDAAKYKPEYENYWPWCWERVLVDALVFHDYTFSMWGNLRAYLKAWMRTTVNEASPPEGHDERSEGMTLDQLYEPAYYSREEVGEVLESMGIFYEDTEEEDE